MNEQLRDILKHWGLEHRTPEKVDDSGAAIATGVWHLGPDYSLKTGGNLEGLKHHIHISRELKNQGITASCPLRTLDGQDFLNCGDHYFVITERVSDNFLSVRQTDAGKNSLYPEGYAREIRAFDAALRKADRGFSEVMAWADKQTAETARSLDMPWMPVPAPSLCAVPAYASERRDFFLCATKLSLSLRELTEALDAKNRPAGLLAMIALFIAWTGSQPSSVELVRGNLTLAADLSRALHSGSEH